MSETFCTNMEHLRTDVVAQTTVADSAEVALKGIAMKLSAAESFAKTFGATEEMLAPFVAVRNDVDENAKAFAGAIIANTSSDEAAVTLTQPALDSTVIPDLKPAAPIYGLAAPASRLINRDRDESPNDDEV